MSHLYVGSDPHFELKLSYASSVYPLGKITAEAVYVPFKSPHRFSHGQRHFLKHWTSFLVLLTGNAPPGPQHVEQKKLRLRS